MPPREKTFKFQNNQGAFTTDRQTIQYEGSAFEITFVSIAPAVEQGVRVKDLEADFEGALLIDKDAS
jgi:hypothetical protein